MFERWREQFVNVHGLDLEYAEKCSDSRVAGWIVGEVLWWPVWILYVTIYFTLFFMVKTILFIMTKLSLWEDKGGK